MAKGSFMEGFKLGFLAQALLAGVGIAIGVVIGGVAKASSGEF
jgi:hypothetical protein